MRAKRSAFDFDFLFDFPWRTRTETVRGRAGWVRGGVGGMDAAAKPPGVRALWLRSTASQAPERTAASGWAGLGGHGVPREPTPPGQARLLIYTTNQPRHEGLSRWPSPSPRARPAAPPGSVPRCHAGTRARPFPAQSPRHARRP